MKEDQQLKHHGLRATVPRQKILEIIRSNGPHMSAEDIYRRSMLSNSALGLGTVYRVLAHLEHAGLIKRNDFAGGKSVYEINEGQAHDHLICLGCGLIEEFVDNTLARRQRKVANSKGFTFKEHKLTLYGL